MEEDQGQRIVPSATIKMYYTDNSKKLHFLSTLSEYMYMYILLH